MVKGVVAVGHQLTAAIAGKADPRITFEGLYGVLAKTTFPIPGLPELRGFVEAINKLPESSARAALYSKTPAAVAARLWVQALRYAAQHGALCAQFGQAPHLEYVARKTEVEKLNTALMNAEVDSRLVSFMQNSATDAKVLAKLIKDKQKFPEEKFESVKQAFPVMIASIREFGEYMPLKKDLLDVLVIDEASQVSVAQAFPALLRARKIVVMGDSNQFANTKSSNASIELNQKHRSELEAFFRREVSEEAAMLERLSYFDVKRSVLEFGQLCANYRIMLRKHFRSYKELIHYSSTTFYGGQLQAIKIRNVPLADCIEINELEIPETGICPQYEPGRGQLHSAALHRTARGGIPADSGCHYALSRAAVVHQSLARQRCQVKRLSHAPEGQGHDIRQLPGRRAQHHFLLDGGDPQAGSSELHLSSGAQERGRTRRGEAQDTTTERRVQSRSGNGLVCLVQAADRVQGLDWPSPASFSEYAARPQGQCPKRRIR